MRSGRGARGLRLLVTRAQGDSERTARRLAERGHEAVIAPVIEIAPLDTPPPAGPFDALIITSAHAAPSLSRLAPGPIPVFTVGGRSAIAAREAGAAIVHEAAGDGAALAEHIRRALPPASRLLHVAGRQRKPEPERTLRACGHEVAVWEVYAALEAEILPEAGRAALAEGQLDGALHYSRRSAEILVRLAQAAGLADALAGLAHAGLSEDALAPLRRLPAARVAAAARPQERFLFEAIESLFRP